MADEDGNTKAVITRVIAVSSLVFVAAAAAEYYRRKSKACKRVIPKLGESTDSGHGGRKIERFPHYVARQLGFSDPSECPQLCELAYDYLRRKEGSEDNIYDYFAADMEDRAKSLCGKLMEELEKCILSYFAFHWNHATSLVTQVINGQSEKKGKLKSMVMAATR